MSPATNSRQAGRDRGSVLPLVLVLMVISALIVIPLLSYAVSVLRANTVVSDATREREAAEAGLRVALLNPTDLFEGCDTVGLKAAPSPAAANNIVVGSTVTTQCAQLDVVGPDDLAGFQDPIAVTATQLGQTVSEAVTGRPIASAPITEPNEFWWSPTPTATTDRVWLPAIPGRPTSVRPAAGYSMPAAFNCKVYLPGYYSAAVSINTGNVYFASGVYYFENDVTISGNANVVVGYGVADLPNDCADDIQASANITTNPGTFDIDGGGATWIFGGNGRLVVDNSATTTSLSFRFNQRYATEAKGGRVSILSVNGDDVSSGDLVVDNLLTVPRSRVNNVPIVHPPVVGAGYVPTAPRFTPKPRVPSAPTIVAAVPRRTAASSNYGVLFLTWNEITGTATGGAPITSYTVRRNGTPVCSGTAIVKVADGVLGCVATGQPSGTQTFTVIATNSAGNGAPSTPPTSISFTTTRTPIAAPAAPAAPTVSVDALEQYSDAVKVLWTPLTAAQASDVPIIKYDVTVERVWQVIDPDPLVPPTEQFETVPSTTCTSAATITEVAGSSCVVTGPGFAALPVNRNDDPATPYLGYRFVVTATNAAGVSLPSAKSALVAVTGTAPYVPPTPTPPPAVPPYVPEPIVDFKLSKQIPTTVSIPGYIALPASRINVDNPRGHNLRLTGGIVAASLTLNDSRMGPNPAAPIPESVPIGLQDDIVLQRKIRLVSTTGRTTVTAVVQINENGDYRINSWVVR